MTAIAHQLSASLRPLGLPYGLHRDVPAEQYHAPALGVVSKSALDQVARSPAHYRAWLDGEHDDTPALRFGQAFHCALLEPARFAVAYATEPDFGDCRKKDNREARDNWRASHADASHADATPLSQDDAERIGNMVAAVRSHPLAGRMVVDGDPELTITWQDEATGLSCKSRADYYVKAHRMVIDAKTTENASPEEFQRSVAKYRYHVQDALYRDAFASVGEPIEHFVIVAVEKRPPFAVALYTLDTTAIQHGYTQARIGIERLAECVRTDKWPAYLEHIKTLELPAWATREA